MQVQATLEHQPEEHGSIGRTLASIQPTDVRSLFELRERFHRFCREVVETDQEQKEEFCKAVESALLSNEVPLPSWGSSVLDPGLFYRQLSQLYPINKFATDLVRQRYCMYRCKTALSKLSGSQQGLHLEIQVWQGMLEQGILNYEPMHAGRNKHGDESGRGTVSKVLKFPIGMEMQSFDGNNFKDLQVELKSGVKLYRPTSKNFPRVDFIVVNYDESGTPHVYLLQTTVTEPSKHLKGSEGNDWIGFFDILDSTESSSSSSSDNNAVTWSKLCERLELDINTPVDYIYITTHEAADQNKDKPARHPNLPNNADICIMPRSKLEQLKIVI